MPDLGRPRTASVRRAGPEDAADILRIREDAAGWLQRRGIDQWRTGEVTRADVLDWMMTGRVYVATDGGGAVVGCVRVAWEDPPTWGTQPSDAGYVHCLVVDRAAAGTGLGAALLQHAEEVVARTGRPLLRLDCWSGNHALQAYYAAAGFTDVGRRSFAPDTGQGPVTLWEKRLSRPGS